MMFNYYTERLHTTLWRRVCVTKTSIQSSIHDPITASNIFNHLALLSQIKLNSLMTAWYHTVVWLKILTSMVKTLPCMQYWGNIPSRFSSNSEAMYQQTLITSLQTGNSYEFSHVVKRRLIDRESEINFRKIQKHFYMNKCRDNIQSFVHDLLTTNSTQKTFLQYP